MSDASTPTIITDARGRKLTLRKMTVIDQTRMFRAIGADQSQNQPYVQIVECAYMVSDIDGLPVPAPVSERQIDAAISRLGDDGVAAVMVHRIAEIQATTSAAEAAAEANGEIVGRADPFAKPDGSPNTAPSSSA